MSSLEYPADNTPFSAPTQFDASADPAQPGLPPLAPVPAPASDLDYAPTGELHELRLNEPVGEHVQEWTQESQYQVILRLADGDSISVGAFADSDSAESYAREVVRYVAEIPAGEWPFFGGRYLRPELIASVDLVERRPMKWSGNEARFEWASATGA